MVNSERPGVYSSYEVSSSLTGSSSGGVVGIAARADSGTAFEKYTVTSAAEAEGYFGSGSSIAELAAIVLKNGAGVVIAVPASVGSAATRENYEAAFAVLGTDEDVKLVICDSWDGEVHALILDGINGASESCKHRIGIVETAGSVSQLTAAAAQLNSERMVLTAPVQSVEDGAARGALAAAVAGVVSSSGDPALPLNGAVLYGLSGLSTQSYTDGEITALVRGGVTPVEKTGGEICVVRGITTRAKTAGTSDSTWRELTTTLIIDDVIPTIRNALKTRFARSKNTAQSRAAIRTQVIIELENKLANEIIDSYDSVTAKASDEDPTVCVVSFGFTVAHGLNQIHLTAHITV